MANPGIYAQFAQPVRSVGDYLGDMDRREGNALELAMKRLQQRTTERGMADEDTARRIFSQYGDKARNPLMEAGLAKQAFALDDRGLALRKSEADIANTGANTRKAEQEARNKQLEEAEKRINLSGSVFRGVMENPTVDNAGRAVEFLRQNGVFPDEQAKGMVEELMQDPTPENVAALAERAFRASISSKDQLEAFKQQNRGGTAAVIGVDPVTGKTRDVQSAPITQSADNAATQATSLTNNAATNLTSRENNAATTAQSDRNNQRTVGASLQNAEANRAIAQAQNNQTQAWQGQMRDIQLREAQAKEDARQQTKQGKIDSVNAQLAVIDKALDHPGRKAATGLSGVLDPRNYIAGTQPRNFQVVLDQINGAAFLQAFESLKGGGQITEVEGKKATDAIARLNRAQGDDEFEQSLVDLRGVMEKGYERLTGQAAPQRKPKGGSKPPAAGPKPASPEDAQAREWATKNPNDPRAKQIMQRLGGG